MTLPMDPSLEETTGHMQTVHRDKKASNNVPFNYDLERMKRQVSSPTVKLPKALTNPDDILRWMLAQ